ncbi:hypothetical protein [Acinetobacter baumannii]|uniref:phage tail fiber protein n=1 Tax=Acinetobacter baumannii TaxID=470 RepID=UPI001EEF9F8E|nr:hypothetical protein [Acinetobacter baumannii]MCG6640958.1 hypothetical protein [Acinetobacter baumannii]
MTIQTVNLGTAPTGAGGDTFRSTGAKVNENFTNNTHAASRYVGTAAGNVMEVGAFGWGANNGKAISADSDTSLLNSLKGVTQAFRNAGESSGYFSQWTTGIYLQCFDSVFAIGSSINSNRIAVLKGLESNTQYGFLYSNFNTTVDANGFLKSASPIVKLFTDKIELNDEAQQQDIVFEKIGVGDYLIKGSTGFAQEGWWIEVPTDANGNRICAVEYQTLENGDLEIKTFKKKLNEEGDIVANLDAPIDIPNNANGEPRWIDVRLNSIKKTIVRKVPRTEKQPRMVQQVKYAPQLTYITKYEDLFDDEGKAVIVDGKNYKKPVTHIQTDQNGTPILSNQPVINENGEPVFEWVQAVDSEGNPVFDDVPVLDKDGNPIYDEVTYDPE